MDSWELVYQANFLDVYRYALSLCRVQALAEDLCSVTFLKAMDSIKGFRGECELRVWLCRITRNLYLSYLRKHQRVIPMEELPEPTEWTDPAELVSQKDEGQRALFAVSQLAEPARQIFLLRAMGKLPFSKIAALYGKRENWACVVYHRARKTVMRTLEEQDEV